MEFLHGTDPTAKEPARRLRVLLVDDNSHFLAAATRLLSMNSWIEVVACATSVMVGVNQVALAKPDVVLVDLRMPGMNGLDATRYIKALPNPPCVILVTLTDMMEYRLAAAEAQVDGVITKSDFGTQIAPLLRKLCNC